MKGINDCSWDEFNYALRVGVTAPFYLTKLFLPYFAPGAAIVNISSSRDRMSQPQTESYTAAKGGITALIHALAVSLAGRVRVNFISPGWPTLISGCIAALTQRSIPQAGGGRLSISPVWCSISALRRLGEFSLQVQDPRRSYGVLRQSIPVPFSTREPSPAGCLSGTLPSNTSHAG